MIPKNPEARTPGEAAAFDALALAWTVICAELREEIESVVISAKMDAQSALDLRPCERRVIRSQVAALKSIQRAMPDLPQDQHPAWLNDVIDGRIEI